MKIILEENDLKRINRTNKANEEEPDVMCGWVQDKNRSYDLTIKVNDVGKANNFLYYLMTSEESERTKIEDYIGISLQSVSYVTKEKIINDIKNQIDDFFNNLL